MEVLYVLIFLAAMALIGFVMVVAFLLGGLFREQRESTLNARIAMGLSIFAVAEAKGLKNSTVIQRIIEKYNIIQKSDEPSEAVKTLEKTLQNEMDDIFSDDELKARLEKKKADQHEFDEIPAKDLV